MQVNEYQKEAMATLNPALNQKDVLINSVMGLCGESGEAIDLVKKWLMQGHELDKEHLIKELGDVAWYLAEAATALDVPLETVFQENLDKLRQRYPQRLRHRSLSESQGGRPVRFRRIPQLRSNAPSRCNATAWCVSIFAWQTAPVLDHTLRSWAGRAI